MRRILFVCTGNICRSPLAAAALRARAHARKLAIEADSAATHAYHVGETADPRAVEAGRRRGYDLAAHRARQVVSADFERHEWIAAMDRDNLHRLREMAPAGYDGRVVLMLGFAPALEIEEVPDPYYGGMQSFERALDLIDAAVDGLLARFDTRSPGQAENP
jgi:low molecular weight protein-tyrosine phosphatase